MIYVIGVERTSRAHDYRYFERELTALRSINLVAGQVLVRSEESAVELYMRLRPHLAPDTDKLFIAEVTSNALGTYIETGGVGIAQALRDASPGIHLARDTSARN